MSLTMRFLRNTAKTHQKKMRYINLIHEAQYGCYMDEPYNNQVQVELGAVAEKISNANPADVDIVWAQAQSKLDCLK